MDWTCRDMPRLWRYNLHYFDWMLDPRRAPEQIQLLTHDWLAHNPPVTPDAWDPYPLSLRVVNWIKYVLTTPSTPLATNDAWLTSLWSQCAWLQGNLEQHIRANHLFKNLKALVFAGAFFDDANARTWLETGRRLLAEQLGEQILPDGGHFERSPMYHAIITEDLLDLLALGRAVTNLLQPHLQQLLAQKTAACLSFLADMSHPDGEISLFNDSAIGIAATPERLFAYGGRLLNDKVAHARPTSAEVLRLDSGYFGWQGASDSWLVDCGPISVDYQPGHAHCDLLSYELSFDGRRVVVDSGVFDYEPGSRRMRARGTAGHNTVMVDGQEQSEIWGTFRVGRRAQPVETRFSRTPRGVTLEGAHDGYRHLRGDVLHRRVAEYEIRGRLKVTDTLSGSSGHVMENFVHLAPGLTARLHGRRVEIRADAGQSIASIDVEPGPELRLELGEYYPEFGRVEQTTVLRLRSEGVLPLHQQYTIERA